MGVVEEQGATDKVREGGRVAGEGGGAVAANSREREERTGPRGRGFLPEKREQTLAWGGGAERMSVWERRKEIEGVCARLREEYRLSRLGLYLQDRLGRREEAAMQSTMGMSAARLYLLHPPNAREFRLPLQLTRALKWCEMNDRLS